MYRKLSNESATLFRVLSSGLANNQLLLAITPNKALHFILFLVCEMLAFVVIPVSTRWGSATAWQLVQIGIAFTFLIITLLLRRADSDQGYVLIFYTFFVAALSILVSLILGGNVRQFLGYNLESASGIAMAKLTQCILRILPLLILVRLVDKNWQSLYLRGGRLGMSLTVGIVAFAAFGFLAYSSWIGDGDVSRRLLLLTPWILLFVFANAIEEELLFRGLFLKRYQPFLGKHGANLLTAVTFTLIHTQVTYAADILQFLVILFPLALAFGYLMQKSNSLWGSVLFHAGADLMIIVAAFATL